MVREGKLIIGGEGIANDEFKGATPHNKLRSMGCSALVFSFGSRCVL